MMRSKAARTLAVLSVTFTIPSVFILAAGANPWRVLATLLGYSLGSQGWSEVLIHATPLTLIGLGIAIALRAGLYNIGSEGQFALGAALAVSLSPWLDRWGAAGLFVFLVLGFVGGALYGAVAGLLRARFNVSEIIATIMLNYVAFQAVGYLIRGPLQEPMHIFPRSETIPDDCTLALLGDGSRLHSGLYIAAAATLICAFFVDRTTFGFKLLVLGANPSAAIYAGFRRGMLTATALAVSGGLAGLSGAIEVAGVYHRLEENMGEGFGLSAIAVALIARAQPLAVPLAALLFGIFFAGTGALQREMGLPFPLVWIIEAMAIFIVVGLQWAIRPEPPAA